MADEISALKEYFNCANWLDSLATCFHLCISEGFVLLKVKQQDTTQTFFRNNKHNISKPFQSAVLCAFALTDNLVE